MIESRRRAYLEALGFDVWVARPLPPAQGRLQLSPGQAGTLLVCAAPAESATRFAGDVVRALGGEACWAWPDTGAGEDSVDPAGAIADRLITRVILFGAETGRRLFPEGIPEFLGSATVAVAPGLDELASRGHAKRALWRLLQDPLATAAPARPA